MLSNNFIGFDETKEYFKLSSSNSGLPNITSMKIIEQSEGKAELLITDEDTSLIDFKNGYWWVTLTFPNGDTVLRGKGKVLIKEPYE